jgi:dolichol-phosphate mannosyltransferase
MANEADNAERFVMDVVACCRGRCRELAFIAVLDRVSRDDTRAILERLCSSVPELVVVYAPENRHVVDAYFRGYREALASGADWILEIDAGYSHQPGDIPAFLAAADGVDCVFATRFARDGGYEGGITRRKIVSWGGSWLTRVLLGGGLSDMTSGFQLFSRRALRREVTIRYRPTAQVVRRSAVWDALAVLSALFVARLLRRG